MGDGLIARRLDRLPISRFHHRVLGLIAAGMFFDGFDVYLAGGVLGALVKDNLSDLEGNAMFISATFVGMTIGAFCSGIFGDKLGRRFSYQVNLGLFGLASLAGAFAPTMGWLIALRFVMGVGLGAEIVTGYAMLAEFVPPSVRGRWTARLAVAANASLFAATLLNFLVLPVLGWRWMFVIAGLGALIVLYLRKALPESPRWLEATGRTEEAERVLQNIEDEIRAEKKGDLPEVKATSEGGSSNTTRGVGFSAQWRNRMLLAIVINVVLGLALYGFVAWVPTFLVKRGIGITATLGYSTIMSIGAPAGALMAIVLSDRIGRKPLLIGPAILATAFGWVYCDATAVQGTLVAGTLLFTAIYLLLSVGVATYIPELFPTTYRLRATGTASTCGRITTIASPFLVVVAFKTWGIFGVYALLASGLVLLVLTIIVFGEETRGRTLEQIDQFPRANKRLIVSTPLERAEG
jgi:putative MFS transporter